MSNPFLIVSAISGLLAVALGAFGAHGLKAALEPNMLAAYQTGVDYHLIHTLVLFLTGILIHLFPDNRFFPKAGWAFFAGILLFSGSLYLLAVTGVRLFGPVTPVGGFAFLVGWGLLAVGASRIKF
jgi:uncharacterized membrane protein YgdD (TMEM256/DUF423 family)